MLCILRHSTDSSVIVNSIIYMKTMERTPIKFMHILMRLSQSNTGVCTSSLREGVHV